MKGIAWVSALLVLVAVGVWCLPKDRPASPSPPFAARPSLTGTALKEPPALRPHPQSEALAVQLNAGIDPTRDVVTLHRILTLYQRALHNRQGTPIGDDIDLARALTGRNPMHQIFIPSTNPALSSDGHLRDRWGTPYFLHPRGQGSFEVRSAGPDRKLFTEDDLVANPGPKGR